MLFILLLVKNVPFEKAKTGVAESFDLQDSLLRHFNDSTGQQLWPGNSKREMDSLVVLVFGILFLIMIELSSKNLTSDHRRVSKQFKECSLLDNNSPNLKEPKKPTQQAVQMTLFDWADQSNFAAA